MDEWVYYVQGAYDNLRGQDLKSLDREIQMAKENGARYFAVGIYDDSLCEALGMGTPLKKVEDRMEIMSQMRGVDFTFKINTLDKNVIRKKLEEGYYKYREEKKAEREPEKKNYKIGYVPGTFDLLHAGHIEHITIAAKQCDILIVGVKADELVRSHKKTDPIIHDYERMEIVEHLKFVHDAYIYYTRDLQIAVDWIRSKYGDDELAVFYGSDLQNDFKNTQIEGVKVVFTERDPKKMKERSTSALKGKLKVINPISPQGRFTSPIPLTVVLGKGAIKVDSDGPSISENASNGDGR